MGLCLFWKALKVTKQVEISMGGDCVRDQTCYPVKYKYVALK